VRLNLTFLALALLAVSATTLAVAVYAAAEANEREFTGDTVGRFAEASTRGGKAFLCVTLPHADQHQDVVVTSNWPAGVGEWRDTRTLITPAGEGCRYAKTGRPPLVLASSLDNVLQWEVPEGGQQGGVDVVWERPADAQRPQVSAWVAEGQWLAAARWLTGAAIAAALAAAAVAVCARPAVRAPDLASQAPAVGPLAPAVALADAARAFLDRLHAMGWVTGSVLAAGGLGLVATGSLLADGTRVSPMAAVQEQVWVVRLGVWQEWVTALAFFQLGVAFALWAREMRWVRKTRKTWQRSSPPEV
jgi:hypothetical protein